MDVGVRRCRRGRGLGLGAGPAPVFLAFRLEPSLAPAPPPAQGRGGNPCSRRGTPEPGNEKKRGRGDEVPNSTNPKYLPAPRIKMLSPLRHLGPTPRGVAGEGVVVRSDVDQPRRPSRRTQTITAGPGLSPLPSPESTRSRSRPTSRPTSKKERKHHPPSPALPSPAREAQGNGAPIGLLGSKRPALPAQLGSPLGVDVRDGQFLARIDA